MLSQRLTLLSRSLLAARGQAVLLHAYATQPTPSLPAAACRVDQPDTPLARKLLLFQRESVEPHHRSSHRYSCSRFSSLPIYTESKCEIHTPYLPLLLEESS